MSTSHDHPRAESVSGLSLFEFETASSPPEEEWADLEDEQPAEPVDPALLARRRQFRSWVGRSMLALALLTVGALVVHGARHRFSDAEVAAPIQAPTMAAAAVVTEVTAAPIEPDAAHATPSSQPAQHVAPSQRTRPKTRVATQVKKPTQSPKPSALVAAAPERKSVLMPVPF